LITDNKCWDEVYTANNLDHQPAFFARYVEGKFFSSGMSLLELGCGNGRDSLFFVEKGKKVQALDLSSKTIEKLSSLNIKNVEFLNQDFSNLSKFSELDYVYSRFTMHSVDEETEGRVFSELSQVLKGRGLE
jgi:ubiquinone/menaquinone biosynthesis C-methylase UbiE